MKMTMEVVDHSKVVAKLEDLPGRMTRELWEAIDDSAHKIRNEEIVSMQRTTLASWSYKRGGKKHHPSAPGFPPARDMGWLMEHILVDTRPDGVEVGAEIYDPPYPMFLEMGTTWAGAAGIAAFGSAGGHLMEPRPWQQPAVDKLIPGIEDDLMRAIMGTV